jgi:hypothetical protein
MEKWSRIILIMAVVFIAFEWLTFPEEPFTEKLVESVLILSVLGAIAWQMGRREKKSARQGKEGKQQRITRTIYNSSAIKVISLYLSVPAVSLQFCLM